MTNPTATTTKTTYYAPASYDIPVDRMSVDWIFGELRELNAIWSRTQPDCLNAAPEHMEGWIDSLTEHLQGLPPYLRCLPAFTPGHLLGTLEHTRARYHKAAMSGKRNPFRGWDYSDEPWLANAKE